jgi:Flp pilus assembly protein CpaB
MGNLGTGLKKFLQNKNTVTVLGVVLAIVILYVAYNMRVKSAINPINVPYALQQIAPGTQITSDMVGTRAVPPSMLEGDVIRNQGDVIDKYSNEDTLIPKGSLFYTRQVVEKEQLNANIILEYPKGYVLYNLSVNSQSTYGNSIYPGNYIDIYLKAVNKYAEGVNVGEDADKVMLGKLLANIKVLAVKDSSGAAVFSNKDEQRAPAMVVFALPEEYYLLLKKAEFMRTFDTTLIPVPTNESLKDEPGELQLSSDTLKGWIEERTAYNET